MAQQDSMAGALGARARKVGMAVSDSAWKFGVAITNAEKAGAEKVMNALTPKKAQAGEPVKKSTTDVFVDTVKNRKKKLDEAAGG